MMFFQTDNLQVETDDQGTATLWFDVAGKSVNVLNRQVFTDLEAVLDQIHDNHSISLLILRSRKKSSFLAGADLHDFITIHDVQEAAAYSAFGQRLFTKLAESRVPSVAVIHGVCLGGGLELALACDYRLALDQPPVDLGLPELQLGLVPGWGGTQRLPRVIGLERAFQVILASKRLDARLARQWGLVDAVARNEQELPEVLRQLGAQARRQGKRPAQRLPWRTWRQKLLESHPLGRYLLFRGAERILRARVPEDMPAPYEALNVLKVGMRQGMDAGFQAEQSAIGRLATTPACRNLVSIFFLREQARKPAEDATATVIRKIGVVGAGTMGAGIAQLAAIQGYAVVVQEVHDAALDAGMKRIQGLLQVAVQRGKLSASDAQRKIADIGRTTTYQGFDDVDLVIEAAIEDMDVKRSIFQELVKHVRPDTILATNTSSLSVGGLQEGLEHSERVAGIHFFNPVHKMPLVEVVYTPDTSKQVIQVLHQWASAIGKTPVIVLDSPGFVVNRVLMPYLNEAVLLLASGNPTERIDTWMRRFGMPMGPLELIDQVGLDVAAHIEKSLRPAFSDRFGPNPLFQRMVERGWLGRKNGVGFYRYRGKSRRVNQQVLEEVQGLSLQPSLSPVDEQVRDENVRDCLVALMVNEAAACLGNGVVADAGTIDLAMVMGTGWAPHRGGPLRYADDRGPKSLVEWLEWLQTKLGSRFTPGAELRRRAESGEPFYPPMTREA
ncbi:MAG: 3-hydroxyacyl-CoA dehydrogenase NAD-binding domain-containing protein [Gemmataceae bacterium]